MWQRYTFYDLRVIAHYLGVLLVYTGAAMAVPLVTAAASSEWEPAARYLFSMGIALTVGSAMRMLRIEPGRLNRQQAIAVTSFAWIVVAAIAAIPLALSPHYQSYLNALFDSVSSFTTTGVTIISNPDHISNADNMWRFISVYAGGAGLVVVAMSFGLFGRVADSSLYESEGRSEHVLPNVVQTARFILRFSLAVIVVASIVLAAICLLHGMQVPRALLHGFWLAVSGYMTGGLTPMSTSITYYHSVMVEGVLMVLMLLGSVSFLLQSEVLRSRVQGYFRDIEVRTAVVWIGIMLALFIVTLSSSTLMRSLPELARTGLFTFISAATTTGFSTLTSNQLTSIMPSGALLILALVMSVGGASGSTAGGIKLKNIAIIGKSAFETLKGVASPDSARVVTTYYHIGRRCLGAEEVKRAMTVFTMFVIMYIVGALVGVAHGYDAVSAITESVAMASNGGISTGITQASMPALLKIMYIAEMWAGRLEFITLLAVGVKICASLRPRGLLGARKGRS